METVLDKTALEAFDREIEQFAFQGHWKMNLPANTEPHSKLKPMHWRWPELREYLLRAGQLITVNEAGRRTIQLINPGLAPRRSTTHTMQMSFQLILPGEVAAAHRHTMAAIRFVVEGGGTYTTVEGESFLMEPGDLILTPPWTWHDHMNESEEPIIWIDGLDVPFAFAMDQVFIQEYHQPQQPVKRVLKSSRDSTAADGGSPWYYKWADSEQRLRDLAASIPPNSGQDIVYEYRRRDGASTLPSLMCGLQLVRRGEPTGRQRRTSSTICHVVRGEGTTRVGDAVFEWQRGDSFVLPNWTWFEHEAAAGSQDSIFFFMSDRSMLDPFGLFREEQAT